MFSSLLKSNDSSSSTKVRDRDGNRIDLQEARKNARTTLKQQHSQLKPFRESVNTCKSSNYYFYGYRGVTMLSLFGGAMVLQAKVPAIGNFGPLLALMGGFYIGGFFHQVHITMLQAKLIVNIDKSLAVLEKSDATVGTNIGISDYREAIDNLQRERIQTLAERQSASIFGFGAGGGDEHGKAGGASSSMISHQQVPVDEHGQPIQLDPVEMEVNRLIENFERRKKIAGNGAK